ncbi:hypothetical protein FDECE_3223 [Fusarium decemcellulare]|nr:hypothetical protein FDECE_3223 [Fusarium decemcellulare]
MSNNCGCNHSASGPAPDAQPNYGEMQAISAILNPLTVGKPKPKIQIWQSLANGTLGFDQLELDSVKLKTQEVGDVKGYYGTGRIAPTLRYTTNLVTLVFDDIVNVYGVTKIDGKNTLSLLSPVFMPLVNGTIDNGVFAGTTNGTTGFLYFQQFDANEHRYVIKEKSLASLKTTAKVVGGTDDSKQNTNLVAFFDGKSRWIAYQTRDDKIMIRCIDRSDRDDVQGSENLCRGQISRLAAVQVVTPSGVNRIYVYFTNSVNEVYRTFSDVKGGSLNFPQAELLNEGLKLNTFSQMSIVPDAANEQNIIYTISEGGSGIERITDAWAA